MNKDKDTVYESPRTIQTVVVDEFTLELNSIGEMRISAKYSDTTLVIEDSQTEEFIKKFSLLQALKKIQAELAKP